LAGLAHKLNHELRETVTQARLLAHRLAPVRLEGEGLMRALGELAAGTRRLPGVDCRFVCAPPVRLDDATVATHLYRIAQEAVNNALKHGRARQIDIALNVASHGVELIVKNNGRPLPAAPPRAGGMGLEVMRYRAETIGATLTITSGPRRGVQVTCALTNRA
jgi:signal transduction histidine kinase